MRTNKLNWLVTALLGNIQPAVQFHLIFYLLALSISHATCKLIIHSPPEYEGEWSTAQIFFGGR
jgi:hypothetical protein